MNMNELVSIIVAVYNVGEYLPRCIESVLGQTYSNLEILLINDGSTDNSKDICERYAKRDGRIKVINKANGGLTSARKMGFEKAHGYYFAFLDGDDYLEKNYVESLFICLLENQSDIAICSYYLDCDGEQIPKNIIHQKTCFKREEYAKELIQPSVYPLRGDKTQIPNFMWLRLYSRKVISDSCFVSEREVYTEHLFFNSEAYLSCDKVAIIELPLYHYCINALSLTHVHRENKYIMEKNRVSRIERVLNQYGIEDTKRLYLANLRLIWECINNASMCSSYAEFKREVRKVFQDHDLRKLPLWEVLSDATFGEKICYLFFKYRMYYPSYVFKKMIKIRSLK